MTFKGDPGSVEMFLVATDATEEASSEFLCDCLLFWCWLWPTVACVTVYNKTKSKTG